MTAPEAKPLDFDLTAAFFKRQEKLRADLGLGDITEHGSTKGDDAELNWIKMLSEFLPGRYGVAKAFVVDAHGSRSEQIDVVVHDRHFSPLLFEVGDAKYIPAESVYAAFEVKQALDKEKLEYAAAKIATVRKLIRTSVDVPHAGGKYDAIVPRRIIGGVLARRSSWSPPFGEAFESCMDGLDRIDGEKAPYGLDIGCAVEDGAFSVGRDASGHRAAMEIRESNVALISFVMQLLQQLQTVGSAPAIDYDQYLDSVPGS